MLFMCYDFALTLNCKSTYFVDSFGQLYSSRKQPNSLFTLRQDGSIKTMHKLISVVQNGNCFKNLSEVGDCVHTVILL